MSEFLLKKTAMCDWTLHNKYVELDFVFCLLKQKLLVFLEYKTVEEELCFKSLSFLITTIFQVFFSGFRSRKHKLWQRVARGRCYNQTADWSCNQLTERKVSCNYFNLIHLFQANKYLMVPGFHMWELAAFLGLKKANWIFWTVGSIKLMFNFLI